MLQIRKYICVLAIFSIIIFPLWVAKIAKASEGDAQWAKSTSSGSSTTYFNGVATDSSGNSYAAGIMNGTGSHNFGNGVTAAGGNANRNTIIVKYDSSGLAQWASSTVVAPDESRFSGVAIDSSGNSYAAGYVTGTGTYNFGNSVTVAGGNASTNTVIVKYNSSGVAQWASVAIVAPSDSYFGGIATDTSGNSYAVGYVHGTGTFNFGNSITVAAANTGGNLFIIKYNSSGVAQWAKTTSTAPGASGFNAVAVDTSGNSYAVGNINGASTYNLGDGITVAGANATTNIVVVKYNSSGVTQWAKSTTTAPSTTYYYGVSVDSSGNSYGVGYVTGSGTYNFGNSVTTSGVDPNSNPLIVKYDSSGVTQWAKSVTAAPGDSFFGGAASDSSGNSYVVGYIYGSGTFNFGNSITVTNTPTETETIIVKYDSGGLAQWAKTIVTGSTGDYSAFYGVSIDSSGNSYAVGEIDGTGSYNFGGGVTAIGSYSGSNPVIVKYAGTATASTASSVSSSSGGTSTEIQIPQMTGSPSYSIVTTPIKDSNTQGQAVLTIIQPQTFGFDAYLFSTNTIPSSLIADSSKGTNAILGGGVGGILGIKSIFGTYWQLGKLQEVWYKTYPPSGHDPARIIPELQSKPSIIAFKYTVNDLIPVGRPNAVYNPTKLKIAHSLDGKNWKILKNTVVDTTSFTVAVVEKVGGYYMIVGQ